MNPTIRNWFTALSIVAALSGTVVLAPNTAHAQSQAQQAVGNTVVANALIQFESMTLWQSMRPSWRDQRSSWMAQVRAATTASALAALMVEFETIMTWEAMAPRWHQERPTWIATARAATTPHAVAQELLALEAATTWLAVNREHWSAVRAAWVAQLRAL